MIFEELALFPHVDEWTRKSVIDRVEHCIDEHPVGKERPLANLPSGSLPDPVMKARPDRLLIHALIFS